MRSTGSVQHFYGHGKLLLTGEYLVLDGAKALAVPTRFGQHMQVTATDEKAQGIHWRSVDDAGNTWLEVEYNEELEVLHATDDSLALRLQQLLRGAQAQQPSFPFSTHWSIATRLEFPRNWGLGSSSTLIHALSSWLGIDPFQLQLTVLGGSAYDIACAGASGPILYQLEGRNPAIEPVSFQPEFQSSLFFVYLGKKQDSRKEVAVYRQNKTTSLGAIEEVNRLTTAIQNSASLSEFEPLLFAHEQLLSEVLKRKPVKEQLFSDYAGAIKSLGAWGGDFVLATGSSSQHAYFRSKGYSIIVPYAEMVLENPI
jgi:mevalonate kinase